MTMIVTIAVAAVGLAAMCYAMWLLSKSRRPSSEREDPAPPPPPSPGQCGVWVASNCISCGKHLGGIAHGLSPNMLKEPTSVTTAKSAPDLRLKCECGAVLVMRMSWFYGSRKKEGEDDVPVS